MGRLILAVGFLGYCIGVLLTVERDMTPEPYTSWDRIGAVGLILLAAWAGAVIDRDRDARGGGDSD